MPRSDRLLLVAFFLSGAAALGYELLWTRLLALALGHELLGVLSSVAGFFAGVSLGAVTVRRWLAGREPTRVFVALEVVAAAYAIASPWLLELLVVRLPGFFPGDAPPGPLASVVIATVTLLPGTLCLGGTLPALVDARTRALGDDAGGARGLARLYAANTFGATVGVLGTVHLWLPAVGFGVGALGLAALGLVAAGLALAWRRGSPRVEAPAPASASVDLSGDPDAELLAEPWLLYAVTFATGLAGVGLEVVSVQILGQNVEGTVYTFAGILAVYLVGAGIGAAIYQRLAARAIAGRPATVLAGLLLALAASTVLSAFALARSPDMLLGAGSSPRYAEALARELLAAAAALLVPTILMGALFSHVVGLVSGLGQRALGRAYALNTLGGALAPFVFGLWAVPTLGYTDGFYAVTYLYLLVFAGFAWFRRFRPWVIIAGVLGVVALTAAGPRAGALSLVKDAEGWAVLERRETLQGVVTVAEYEGPRPEGAPPLRRLQVNQHFKMGGVYSFGERRMGQLATLLAPPDARALFLGVGTGATMGAALEVTPGAIRAATGVELVPAVLELLPYFAATSGDLAHERRATLVAADARRYLAAGDAPLELIVADLFHPARDGAASLYAREHFARARARLSDDGVFVQWLPLYQLSRDDLAAIVRAFLEVFPEHAHAFLGFYNVETPPLALVGSRVPVVVDPARVQSFGARPSATIVEARDLLAAHLLDGEGLARFVGDGPVHHDLDPRVLFSAPRVAYEDPPDLGARTLAALLEVRAPYPPSMVPGDDLALRAATERYAEAVDAYLRGELLGHADGPTAPVSAARLERYLAAYEREPGFPPARGALFRAAKNHPERAAAIYERMLERTPDEPRVYRAYAEHLRQRGDTPGLDRLLERARARRDAATL